MLGVLGTLARCVLVPRLSWGSRVLVASSATTTLLRQEDSTNSFVDRLELCQVGRRNLDGVTGHGQDDNVLPWVKLVLVLDHLGALPVILNPGSLQ